ncbi:MAG: RHS repeat-associated core domain-containing protein, partial [Pyrinomonadaceae bacterium]
TSVVDVDPWGGETSKSSNQAFQPHRFTSYERDGNSGDDAQQRRYQSYWMRFAQPDPTDQSYDVSDPQSFNRYSYTQNDPVNFTDPTGLFQNVPPHVFNETVTVTASIDNPFLDSFFGGIGTGLAPRPITEGEPRGGGPRGDVPQDTGSNRNPRDVKREFYDKYGKAFNDCIEKVFKKDAKRVPQQTLRNAPVLDATQNRKQVGAIAGRGGTADGTVDAFKGRNGTIYIASEVFNGNTPNTMNAIFATYAHETANKLDIRLNWGKANAGWTYGNPKDTWDTDTGAAVERCLFGSPQYP